MEEPRVEPAITLGVLVVAASLGIALVTVVGAAATTHVLHRVPDRTLAASPPRIPDDDPGRRTTTTTARGPDHDGDRGDRRPGCSPADRRRPIASGATFAAGVNGLWQAIRLDRPRFATAVLLPGAPTSR